MWSTGQLNMVPKQPYVKKVSFKKKIQETIVFQNDKKQFQAQILTSSLQKCIASKKLSALLKIINKSKAFSSYQFAAQYINHIFKSKQRSLQRSVMHSLARLKLKQQHAINLLNKISHLFVHKKTQMKKILFAKVIEIEFREAVQKKFKSKCKTENGLSGESKRNLPVLKEKADQAIDDYFSLKNTLTKATIKINCEQIDQIIKQSQQQKLFNPSESLIQTLQGLTKYDKNAYNYEQLSKLREMIGEEMKIIEKTKLINKIPKTSIIPYEVIFKVLQNNLKHTLEIMSRLKTEESKSSNSKVNQDLEALKKLKLVNNSKEIRERDYKKAKQAINLSIECGNQLQMKTNITNLLRKFTEPQLKPQLMVYETLNGFVMENESITRKLEEASNIVSKLGEVNLKISSSLILNSIRTNRKECALLINKYSKQSNEQNEVLGMATSIDKLYGQIMEMMDLKNNLIQSPTNASGKKIVNLSLEKPNNKEQNNETLDELNDLKREIRLKNQEVDRLSIKLTKMQKIQQQLQTKTNQVKETKKQLLSAQAKYQALQTHIHSQNTQREILITSLAQKDKQKDSIVQELTNIQILYNKNIQNDSQLKVVKQLEDRVQQLRSRIKAITDANNELTRSNESLKAMSNNIEEASEAMFQAYEKETKKNKELQCRIQSLIQTNNNMNQFIEEQTKRNHTLSQKISQSSKNPIGNILIEIDEYSQTIKENQLQQHQSIIQNKQQRQLQTEVFQLKQQNSNLKTQITSLKNHIQSQINQSKLQPIPNQDQILNLDRLVKSLESQNIRLTYLLKQKNEEKVQIYQIIYNLTDQLEKVKTVSQFNKVQEMTIQIKQLKEQLNTLQLNHCRIVEDEVLKAISIQEKQINEFLKQNDKDRDQFYETVIIPERKRIWEIQMQAQIDLIVNSQRKIWEQKWLNSYKQPQTQTYFSQNPEK